MWSARFCATMSRSTVAAVSSTMASSITSASTALVRHHPSPFVSVTCRAVSTFSPSPLDAFRDSVDRETRATQPVGRPWSVIELRRKSYDDLHKLWYVLYMERNMLLTEQQLSRRRQLRFPQPQRISKVQKSMQAIKQVLGERKRQKISEFNTSKLAEAMQEECNGEEIEMVVEK
jgi:large subunit ribosomal protein L47